MVWISKIAGDNLGLASAAAPDLQKSVIFFAFLGIKMENIQELIQRQGQLVRSLKAAKAPEDKVSLI